MESGGKPVVLVSYLDDVRRLTPAVPETFENLIVNTEEIPRQLVDRETVIDALSIRMVQNRHEIRAVPFSISGNPMSQKKVSLLPSLLDRAGI